MQEEWKGRERRRKMETVREIEKMQERKEKGKGHS
jgi:hypothetical protein